MTGPDLLRHLEKKGTKPESVASRAIRDPKLVPALLDGFCSKIASVRFKSAKALVLISERQPALLYPHFEFFARHLANKNNILKWNAIDVIARLTQVDTDRKFDKLFAKFFGTLQEGSLITGAHVLTSSGLIAKSKPHLERKIANKVFELEDIPLPTRECRNILKGHAIKMFDQHFSNFQEKEKIINFARRELKNTRAATRKKAQRFLKKWAG